jgi:hypothetical protein
VYELRISADCDNFGAHFFEPVGLLRQSSKFGRSNKCKIGRIEEKDGPLFLRFCLFETEGPKIFSHGIVRLEFKRRDRLSNSQRVVFTHTPSFPFSVNYYQ